MAHECDKIQYIKLGGGGTGLYPSTQEAEAGGSLSSRPEKVSEQPTARVTQRNPVKKKKKTRRNITQSEKEMAF